MRFAMAACLTSAVCGVISSSKAVDIMTWGSPTNIAGDSDVITTGTLLYACNFGGVAVPSATVNGVNFAPFPITNGGTSFTVGDVTISESPDALYSMISSSTSAPFTGLSANYQVLLGDSVIAGADNTITLQLGGLTSGQSYAFQLWSNNSGNFGVYETTQATATNPVTLYSNTTVTDGGLGQYAVGTFAASGNTFSMTIAGLGNSVPLITAFQLRTVPEPSTWILGTIAAGVMLRAVSRKRSGGRRS